jgi:hypothetical protein
MAAKKVIATQEIRDEKGGTLIVSDYRFAPYGQGPGMLALATGAQVDAIEGSGFWVRLDTKTPEGAIVAVELTARAAVVIR